MKSFCYGLRVASYKFWNFPETRNLQHATIFLNYFGYKHCKCIQESCHNNAACCHIVFFSIENHKKTKIWKYTQTHQLQQNFHLPEVANPIVKWHFAEFNPISNQQNNHRNCHPNEKSGQNPVESLSPPDNHAKISSFSFAQTFRSRSYPHLPERQRHSYFLTREYRYPPHLLQNS